MITLDNVTYSYSKSKSIFANLSLELHPGKIYGLLGKNGVGKSTLLKLIFGGLFPTGGSIRLGDFTPSQRRPQMYQNIFYLPEDVPSSHLSINQYVRANANFYAGFDKEQLHRTLHMFEIDLSAKINQMSYGQTKKFHLAFGLACKTKYVFLDEPTNGLDIPSKSQFRKVMISNLLENQVVIISTHQVKDLSKLIDSILILDEGKILLAQELSEIETKLQFLQSAYPELDTPSIYKERVVGGYLHLVDNISGEPSELDLEILFNSILNQKEKVLNLLSK